jgi:TonB family protein
MSKVNLAFQLQGRRKMRLAAVASVIVPLLAVACVAYAQTQSSEAKPPPVKSPIVTIRLGTDQIGTVKTGEKLSTRLSFREPVKEVICGDLYDPTSGVGSFVIQRLDNDVFIKPVVSKGVSNLFVKTGEKGEYIYNFSLLIVPADQAYLVVKVIGSSDNAGSVKTAHKRLIGLSPPITDRITFVSYVPGSNGGFMASLVTRPLAEMGEPPPPIAPKPLAVKPIAPNPIVARVREPIRRIRPDYPESARMVGVTGEVLVEVTVNRKGKVKKARALSGPPALRGPSVVAARLWRFTPAEEGAQDPYLFTIKFKFHGPDRTDSGLFLDSVRQDRRRP